MADDTAYLDQYNGASLVVTSVIFLVLTWLSVALRTYVRAFMTNAFQMDDWLMLVAQVRSGQEKRHRSGLMDIDMCLTRETTPYLVCLY